jgi:hypothetical protein
MKMKNVMILLLFIVLTAQLKGQDTIKLTTSELIVCRVTEIRSAEIEYLPWQDESWNYHTIAKPLIHYIKYASGKCDTFNKPATVSPVAPDTFGNKAGAYQQGYDDGFKKYHPVNERVVGSLSVLAGLPGIAIPIIISTTNVKASKIKSPEFVNNTNQYYRNGYLEGASKRRRNAVWSAYGITSGALGVASLVALVALLSYF